MAKDSPWEIPPSKHSPGPWEHTQKDGSLFPRVYLGPSLPWKDGSGFYRPSIVINEGHTPEAVEAGIADFGLTMENVNATASIITAAPDFYDLAKEIVERDPAIGRDTADGYFYACAFCAGGDFHTTRIKHTDNCWWVRTREVLRRL